MFEVQESKIKTARACTTNAAPRHGLESHQEITTIHALLLVAIKHVRWNLALHPKVINKPKLQLECKEKMDFETRYSERSEGGLVPAKRKRRTTCN